jgi:hypothetical protein
VAGLPAELEPFRLGNQGSSSPIASGYISSPTAAALIDSPWGHQRITESILRVVKVHSARRLAQAM